MATDPKSDAAHEVSDQAEYRRCLTEAPIAEFAKYAGIGIDEAVSRRVEAAKAAPPPLEVTARPIAPQGNLYGFASVKIGGLTVDDFKIVADKDGKLFVGMPSKPDKASKTGYRNTVRIDPEYREAFGKAVLGAHYDAVEALTERAAAMKAAPEKPRIAEQAEKAAKEAAAHNEALPPKGKGGKKREAGRE
jgi:DNA-binding cell septation regulator SpoVG